MKQGSYVRLLVHYVSRITEKCLIFVKFGEAICLETLVYWSLEWSC